MTIKKRTKKLYTWLWTSGGYNQCYAYSKREARKIGNSMFPPLRINESTFHRVRNTTAFWAAYPSNL